jgi:uncharacterized protein YunC (DUF1805 family)
VTKIGAPALPFPTDFSGLFLADSVTKLPAEAAQHVVVSGSHGGRYPGFLAALGRARGVILNDAGIGKDGAGVAALADLDRLGAPAATVSHMSCRIGDAADTMQRGVISRANAAAQALGVTAGDACRDAALRLRAAPPACGEAAPLGETRGEVKTGSRRRVVLLDSASLVRPEDAGEIVVTGSHGGLVGGAVAAALRVDAFATVFNDAGIGMEEAGVARIAPLDARGIAAFTVAAFSARIGEAQSTYADGVVSRANATARRLGVREGDAAHDAIQRLARL